MSVLKLYFFREKFIFKERLTMTIGPAKFHIFTLRKSIFLLCLAETVSLDDGWVLRLLD